MARYWTQVWLDRLGVLCVAVKQGEQKLVMHVVQDSLDMAILQLMHLMEPGPL